MDNQEGPSNSTISVDKCVDLTLSDDDDEDEIQVIPSEADITREALLNAPTEQIVAAINQLIGIPAAAVTVTVPAEVIQLDDDEDDDEAEEPRAGPSDQQSPSEGIKVAKIYKTEQLIEWFSRLKKHHFAQVAFNQRGYVRNEITAGPVVDPAICRQILKKYKAGETTDALRDEFGLANEELVVAAICVAVVEKDNDLDIDFTELCDDRIDEVSLKQVDECLQNPYCGVIGTPGPLQMMQKTLLGPSHMLLALTLCYLRDSGLPCRCEIDREAYEECAVVVEPHTMLNYIIETSVSYAQGPHVIDACRLNKELEAVVREMNAVHSILGKHDDVFNESEEIRKMQMRVTQVENPSEDDMTAARALVLSKEQLLMESVEEAKFAELREQMKAYRERMAVSFNSKDEFIRKLIIHPGDYCLARLESADDREMQFANVLKHTDCDTYLVKFCETGQEQMVDVRDLALTVTGLHDPVFDPICEVGLRVAVYAKGRYHKANRLGWYSGTTAGRNYNSKGELLVFLDNEVDLYVPVPRKPGDSGYEEASDEKKPASLEEVKQKMIAMRMAVMVYQSVDEHGAHDRFHVDRMIRAPERADFIRKYVAAHPEYSLLRMPIGTLHTIYTSLSSVGRGHQREKAVYKVIDVENAFAHVRKEEPSTVPGSDCVEKDCRSQLHQHCDEVIYRGSLRIEGIEKKKEMCLAGNSNLSRRRRGQYAQQFEPSVPDRPMPIRKTQQQAVRMSGSRGSVKPGGQPAQRKMAADEIAQLKKKQALINVTVVETPVLPPLESLRPHKQCGPDCLKDMDADPCDPRFYRNSPLHTPLLCGWRRKKLTYRSGKKRARWMNVIIYYAPCGKMLDDVAKIVVYLRETRSQLTIDCFSFDHTIRTETYVTVDANYIKCDDFANGIEGIPIPLVNSVDSAPSPVLEYSKRRFQYDDTVNLSTITRDFCSGCSCEGDCSDASKCECQQLTKDAMMRLPKSLRISDEPYYINRTLHTKVITGQYECNDQCSCQRNSCHNRVVQNNIKYPIHIFKTAQSGWGIRALTDIPSGAFVCNYVGAMLTDRLADQLRNEDQYFADLDLKDAVETAKMEVDNETDQGIGDEVESGSEEDFDADNDDDQHDDEEVVMRTGKAAAAKKSTITTRSKRKAAEKRSSASRFVDDGKEREKGRPSVEKEDDGPTGELGLNWDDYFDESALFVVDAKQRGNLGRFLNHSCEPNVHVQHVLYDTHDLRLPWVAFFTCEPVKAGDELCWDYRYTVLNDDVERLNCHCGAEKCRRRLL